MPKKSERAVSEIISGLMMKPQVPCSRSEALTLSVWANTQRLGGAAEVKSRLRCLVHDFSERSRLAHKSQLAAQCPLTQSHFGVVCSLWNNAANLLNAELNR